MTHREIITAILRGQKPEIIPCHGECPMDVTVFRDLMPPATGDPVADQISHAQFFDNACCGVGIGPKVETISHDDNHSRYRYETGAEWVEIYRPTFNREAVAYPINTPQDALKFTMPSLDGKDHFDETAIKKMVADFHEAGYFVEGSVMGAWAGIYYFLTRFENILLWMGVEPEAAQALFDLTRRYSVDSAKRLLACGVDAIFTFSDLGSGQGLLFSPRMFRQYVFPWLKELADLSHGQGAFLHLHSHGHIEDVMDGIVEAGVDMINPIGPSDHNDLAMFKGRWGDRITIHGGISTTINRMTKSQIEQHVAEVMAIGRVGGRFIPRTESGIPPMPLEMALHYVRVLKEERAHGYA